MRDREAGTAAGFLPSPSSVFRVSRVRPLCLASEAASGYPPPPIVDLRFTCVLLAFRLDFDGLRGSAQYPTLLGDRPGFAPGETYYSVLVAEGAELKRYDYAADAWQGPPAEAVGWWKSQIPDRTPARNTGPRTT